MIKDDDSTHEDWPLSPAAAVYENERRFQVKDDRVSMIFFTRFELR